jgi:hypothetical protein
MNPLAILGLGVLCHSFYKLGKKVESKKHSDEEKHPDEENIRIDMVSRQLLLRPKKVLLILYISFKKLSSKMVRLLMENALIFVNVPLRLNLITVITDGKTAIS